MGRAIIAGGNRATEPIKGIAASELAVGSAVKLKENGTNVEYLVVHQGLPSSLYDESCDGTWLLRKDVNEKQKWNSSNKNDYANSTIQSYLNVDFFNLFDVNIQNIIKQIKIPYRKGIGYSRPATSGGDGLSCKIFLLAAKEVGLNLGTMPTGEGEVLSFFAGTSTEITNNRISYLNGTAADWWLRSPYCSSSADYGEEAIYIKSTGTWGDEYCNRTRGIRPALILPSDALFDAKNLTLKGAA
nr:MAG TPA: hypothetical protein [Caudoviricetes sp.]